MLDYFIKTFISLSYLPLFMQLFILAIAVALDPYIQTKRKRIMGGIIVLILSFIVDNAISDYLILEVSIPFARLLECMYVYIFRPVLIVLFCYLVQPDKKHKIAWGIVGLNTVVYLSALICPIHEAVQLGGADGGETAF